MSIFNIFARKDNVMNAVAKLCGVYKDQLNEDTFRDKVGAVCIKLLTRTAKERRAGSMGFAEAMILEYNGKKKSPGARLDMNRMYAKDVSLWVEPDEDEEFTEEEYEAEDILEDEDDESPALF